MSNDRSSNDISQLSGSLYVDDRGVLVANNNFQVSNYKRFYVIRNHQTHFVRAWHGHRHESKAMICLRGSFKIGIASVKDFNKPDASQTVETFILDQSSANVLIVPPGHANGFMNLALDSELLIFSDKTLVESMEDDVRLPFDFWNIWDVVQR
jgi:dTDP-4-dehydrorhamnose 3,5-epimerase